MTTPGPDRLRAGFAELRRDGKTRHRDIAAALGVSEGELIAAHAIDDDDGSSRLVARRLRPQWPQLVAALEPVGELMALTRNRSCVHEKTGVYRNSSHVGDPARMGLVLGGEIDLRVFYSQWSCGYAVDETTAKGTPQRSLQFFDLAGTAIHKVFVRPGSDLAAWSEVVGRFAAEPAEPGWVPAPIDPIAPERADSGIDVASLRERWSSMRDTHEFFGLLKLHGVTRTQALRLAEPRFVQRVDATSAHQVLNAAAATGVPIMVFVGNPGMIQIHSGAVKRVAVMGPWLNVLDDGFNLHMREDHVAAAWVVKKPTADGLVTSLELFDAKGETIAMLFGERKPGQVERCDWRELVDELLPEATHA